MKYQSFPPSAALSELVRNYTLIHFDFDKRVPVPYKQRSPKAEQKIAFYIRGSVTHRNTETGVIDTPPSTTIFSHQLERKQLQVTPEFLALIVYLKPGALFRLIGLPMTEFPSEYCNADIFFGNEVGVVQQQLSEATSPEAMIRMVERFLRSRCKHEINNRIDTLAAHMLSDPTMFSLDSLADQACLSSKQFYRNFVQQIGISPKLFSRLSRFNHANQYKLINPKVSWSSIAQEFAYTDYHHLEKEFKSFLGVTPAEWIAIEHKAPERMLKLR